VPRLSYIAIGGYMTDILSFHNSKVSEEVNHGSSVY
jgi:hypothetical protein